MPSYYIRRGHWVDACDAHAASKMFNETMTDITEVIDDEGAISVVHSDGSVSTSASTSGRYQPSVEQENDDDA